MEEWQSLAQSVLIGLIFSFLVAKLISTVISFREDNLRLVRHQDLPAEPLDAVDASSTKNELLRFDPSSSEERQKASSATERLVGGGASGSSSVVDDDDDWEGVESTELDEAFSAATAFVAASAADRLSQKVPNDVQLQLYGLYKIATEGPCSAPQPSALKMTARAKWTAWQRLGAMPPEEAMQKYIMIVNELFPSWASGAAAKGRGGASDEASSNTKGPMGPVFSTFVHDEESENDLKMDVIHDAAREGEMNIVHKCITSGVSVNARDSEGRTPLHWAVDRGHLNVVELLISRNADVNAQDNEGQTPLHYAVVCEREAVAELLVKQNADSDVKDNDGNAPRDLCESAWECMMPGK